ncbi:ComF family protein [Aestuariivirga sp.]|uniref:ComF family protein n=1 Tax=Aestuariivirga sp. TaxID=2650926 RepID=UPI0025C39BDE|nr:ComF family protein [Aestuariivirga sp.]MCA3554994.1 ComF family protein [Aestuariivirga sp.]
METVLSGLPARIWRGFVDLVTPSLCLSCGTPVGEAASLCVVCWGRLKLLEEPVCDALGTPFAYDQGEGALSGAALSDPPAWDRARAAVLFEEEAAKLVHALKYRDRPEAGLLMARMMARAGRRLLAQADVILPVPLHVFRLWLRRFNQSALLAQRISRLSGTPWRHDVLIRARSTRAQVGLDQGARRRNVRNAFTVRPGRLAEVAGRSVLLVDDVRTTGATAEACALALKKAGAARVELLTFALVQFPAKPHI